MYKIDKGTIASELIIEAREMKGKRPTQLNFEELVDVAESLVKKLLIPRVSNFKRDETLELLEEIMLMVKEADSEVENGIYDPMLECAKTILNKYEIIRR